MGCTCEYTCSNLQREITRAQGEAHERGVRRTGGESGIETCAARVTKVEGAEGRGATWRWRRMSSATASATHDSEGMSVRTSDKRSIIASSKSETFGGRREGDAAAPPAAR